MLLRLTFILITILSFPVAALEIKVHKIPGKSELRASAFNNGIAWVGGNNNTIYKSLNKGKSWVNVSLQEKQQYDIRDIEIINAQTAIAMAAGNGRKSALFITHDQGNNWQLLHTNPDEQGFYNSIAFINKDIGYLMGDPITHHFLIRKTVDGGKTWFGIDLSHLPIKNQDEIAFAASGNTLITTDLDSAIFVTGGKQAFIYLKPSDQMNWTKQALPLHSKTPTSGAYSLSSNNKGDIFALGGDYKNRSGHYANIVLLKKEHAPQVVNIGGLVTAMQCHKALCIAVGKTNTYISNDHGYHWSNLDMPNADGFYTITEDNGTFIAAGSNGKIATFTGLESR